MSRHPTTCIIGAGSSGITAAKALHERGLPFTCFEASDEVGGNWLAANKNGTSAAYRNLHINNSRTRMEFSDFPMPASLPDFPHHSHVGRYCRDYVDHFGIRDQIVFETTVERAELTDEGVWRITLDTGDVQYFDALVVANGHHWNARWPDPEFPGSDSFHGVQMHSHDYVDSDIFRDRDVVVLGMGDSAMDIAVESSYVARSTYLAARRGAWIVPKSVFGRPIDQVLFGSRLFSPRIPFEIRRRGAAWLVRLIVGAPERYGLPKPDHSLGQAHPTVSGRLLDRVSHGVITPKPTIARLGERSVEFADGSVVDADVVVYCTGYKITFPFFDEDFISAPDNRIPLYRRVFHPEIPSLFFVGLIQATAAIMPIAEAQGRWVAQYLEGRYALPTRDEMKRDIQREASRMAKRYVASKRHTIQVDFDDHLAGLRREVAAGNRRARARRFAPPVPARSRALPTG